MVRPALRSAKKKYVRTPGARTVLRTTAKKAGRSRCAETGAVLHGTISGPRVQSRRMAKSRRRPNRIYGGNISPVVLKRKIRAQVRMQLES